MQIYLVGGAVRDKLLNIKNNDKDFVVVGSSVQQMLSLGYKKIGKDFPVFLHPQTKDEYALARVERKVSAGYSGFKFTTKDITLKQDLSRRDLTINAMAVGEDGVIIDYFGGKADLQQKVLRHINKSFCEDPVRILRVARFSAKFKHANFTIADETYEIMQKMVASGEVDCLVVERIWQELDKSLSYDMPSAFFQTLVNCTAYIKIFQVKNVTNFEFLDHLTTTNDVKFALWLLHYNDNHLQKICKKLKVPTTYSQLAKISNLFLQAAKKFSELTTEQILDFYIKTDALRRINRFEKILSVWQFCQIQTKNISNIHKKLLIIDISKLDKNNIVQEIQKQRLKVIHNYKK